jgi:hypothetical protein
MQTGHLHTCVNPTRKMKFDNIAATFEETRGKNRFITKINCGIV